MSAPDRLVPIQAHCCSPPPTANAGRRGQRGVGLNITLRSMEPMKPMTPMKPLTFSEPARWWPAELGNASSAGSQNDVHYAYFRSARRLLLRRGSEIVTYDTGDHDIYGVSQASDANHATFTSNRGTVNLGDLKRL